MWTSMEFVIFPEQLGKLTIPTIYGRSSILSSAGVIDADRLIKAAQGEARRQLSSPSHVEKVTVIYIGDTKKGILFDVEKRPIVGITYVNHLLFDSAIHDIADVDVDTWARATTFGLLFVQDPSQPKEYAISVPPGMRAVDEALLWTFNLSARVFAPTIHT